MQLAIYDADIGNPLFIFAMGQRGIIARSKNRCQIAKIIRNIRASPNLVFIMDIVSASLVPVTCHPGRKMYGSSVNAFNARDGGQCIKFDLHIDYAIIIDSVKG